MTFGHDGKDYHIVNLVDLHRMPAKVKKAPTFEKSSSADTYSRILKQFERIPKVPFDQLADWKRDEAMKDLFKLKYQIQMYEPEYIMEVKDDEDY